MKNLTLSLVVFFSFAGVSLAQSRGHSGHYNNYGFAPYYNGFTGYNTGYGFNRYNGYNSIRYPNGSNFVYRNGYMPNFTPYDSGYGNYYQYNFGNSVYNNYWR